MASDQNECRVTTLNYTVYEKGTDNKKGEVHIRIARGTALHEWHEVRKYGEEETDVFDVVFDPDTLMPTRYVRRMSGPGITRVLRLEIEGRQLAATITENGEPVSRQRLSLPDEKVIIEPFMKYYLSRRVGDKAQKGAFKTIGLLDDELKISQVEWETQGSETIEVPAGRFECIKVRMTPAAWYLKFLDLSIPVWLEADGSHYIIRTPVRRSLFSEERSMVLKQISHESISCQNFKNPGE
jgi:hypothetical protein